MTTYKINHIMKLMKQTKKIEDGDLLLDEVEEFDRDIDEGGDITVFLDDDGEEINEEKQT